MQPNEITTVIPEQVVHNEGEFVLKEGINVLRLPTFNKQFDSHPMVVGKKESKVPLTAEDVQASLIKFFESIQSQGGAVVTIIEVPVTTNMEKVRYAGDQVVENARFVIVKK